MKTYHRATVFVILETLLRVDPILAGRAMVEMRDGDQITTLELLYVLTLAADRWIDQIPETPAARGIVEELRQRVNTTGEDRAAILNQLENAENAESARVDQLRRKFYQEAGALDFEEWAATDPKTFNADLRNGQHTLDQGVSTHRIIGPLILFAERGRPTSWNIYVSRLAESA